MADICCRPVVLEDSLDLFAWRNDPVTRLMSLNTSIVSKDEHSEWFSKMLNSATDIGIIGEIEGSKVGVVFFKIEAHQSVVSINLNPLYRGQKLATTLLKNAIYEVQTMSSSIKYFVAEIKNKNTASKKIFLKIGFSLSTKNEKSCIYIARAKKMGVTFDF
jgi:UDP-2,4-diacetamido-2,4,6-trideoxy-beta-L-altropyranose hydrolase